jgi:uncharacterized protein (TIGR03435 family)
MMGAMLRTLLEDRFKVQVHRESRDKSVYLLTVAKDRPGLQPSREGSCTPPDVNNLQNTVPHPGARDCGAGGGRSGPGGVWVEDWHGVTMDEFAGRMLSGLLDRPVIDKTGLSGRFDVHLEFAREQRIAGPARLNGVDTPLAAATPAEPPGPSIFTALQNQLGLNLSPARNPMDVIVVDRAERPSGN